MSELKTKEADMLATQIAVQQLQERDQLLAAQNEMLKVRAQHIIVIRISTQEFKICFS